MAGKSADGLEALHQRISALERENKLLRGEVEKGPDATSLETDHNSTAQLANTRMRALLRGATDYAIIETDPQGRITFWNSGATALLGWNEDEAIGQNISLLFTPEDQTSGEPERERRDAIASGQSDSERWHIVRTEADFMRTST